MGTPLADAELTRVPRAAASGAVTSSFLYHYARLIEILAALERIEQPAGRPRPALRPTSAPTPASTSCEGVGVSEAPRGTLFHHYQVDEHGLMRRST